DSRGIARDDVSFADPPHDGVVAAELDPVLPIRELVHSAHVRPDPIAIDPSTVRWRQRKRRTLGKDPVVDIAGNEVAIDHDPRSGRDDSLLIGKRHGAIPVRPDVVANDGILPGRSADIDAGRVPGDDVPKCRAVTSDEGPLSRYVDSGVAVRDGRRAGGIGPDEAA